METVYLYCAAIGGGLLLIQVILLLVGGGDTDLDGDMSPDVDLADAPDAGDAASVVVQLSVKTVIAFITFFGLAGMASIEAEFTQTTTLLTAIGSGAAAFFLVGYLISLLMSLQSDGNVDLKDAVGSSATVYLRIPEKNTGSGKVTVAVGGRMMTKKAITKGEQIPTGTEVIIRGMTAPDTFEVSTL
jgi:hypothetical protein